MMGIVAIYPGSFDPITNGHLDLIHRSITLFDEVVVAVAQNVEKRAFIPLGDRVDLLKRVTESLERVTVTAFTGLLVDFARQVPAHVIIRGLRAVSDFEFELQMALTNRTIAPDLETVFLMPSGRYVFLSSRLVRELWLLKGPFERFVPEAVAHYLCSMTRPEQVDVQPG